MYGCVWQPVLNEHDDDDNGYRSESPENSFEAFKAITTINRSDHNNMQCNDYHLKSLNRQ